MTAKLEVFDCYGDANGEWKDSDARKTVGGVRVTLPDGRDASAFLSIVERNGRFYAYLSHDATNYAKGPTDAGFRWLSKELRLSFFKPATLRKQEAGSA